MPTSNVTVSRSLTASENLKQLIKSVRSDIDADKMVFEDTVTVNTPTSEDPTNAVVKSTISTEDGEKNFIIKYNRIPPFTLVKDAITPVVSLWRNMTGDELEAAFLPLNIVLSEVDFVFYDEECENKLIKFVEYFESAEPSGEKPPHPGYHRSRFTIDGKSLKEALDFQKENEWDSVDTLYGCRFLIDSYPNLMIKGRNNSLLYVGQNIGRIKSNSPALSLTNIPLTLGFAGDTMGVFIAALNRTSVRQIFTGSGFGMDNIVNDSYKIPFVSGVRNISSDSENGHFDTEAIFSYGVAGSDSLADYIPKLDNINNLEYADVKVHYNRLPMALRNNETKIEIKKTDFDVLGSEISEFFKLLKKYILIDDGQAAYAFITNRRPVLNPNHGHGIFIKDVSTMAELRAKVKADKKITLVAKENNLIYVGEVEITIDVKDEETIIVGGFQPNTIGG